MCSKQTERSVPKFPVCPLVSLGILHSGVNTAVCSLCWLRRRLIIPASPQDVRLYFTDLCSTQTWQHSAVSDSRLRLLSADGAWLHRSLNLHLRCATLVISGFILGNFQSFFYQFYFYSHLSAAFSELLRDERGLFFSFLFFLDDDSCEAAPLESGMKNRDLKMKVNYETSLLEACVNLSLFYESTCRVTSHKMGYSSNYNLTLNPFTNFNALLLFL